MARQYRDSRGRFVSQGTHARITATQRYWRAIHAIQSVTDTTAATARRAYAVLDLKTAAAVYRNAADVQTVVDELEEPPEGGPGEDEPEFYDLDDWLDEDWDDHDVHELSGSVNYVKGKQ